MHFIGMAAKGSDGLGGIAGYRHPMACRARNFASHFANECFILNQKDGSIRSS
jgi:hypothetical protein